MSITMWSGKDSAGREVLRIAPDEVALYRAAPEMLDIIRCVLDWDAINDVDVFVGDAHTTRHVCIGCGGGFREHDEDCFIPRIKSVLEKVQ